MINKLIQSGVALFFFCFPVFFLTNTSDFYDYNKLALLIVFSLVFLLLFCFEIVTKRRVSFVHNSFGNLLFLLTLVITASTLLQSPNLEIALTTPLSVSTFLAGFLLYFLLVNSVSEKQKSQLFLIIIFSSVFICLYTLLLFLQILPKSSFTPGGNIFTTALFLAVMGVFLAVKLFLTYLYHKEGKESDLPTFIFYALSLLIVLASVIMLGYHLATDQQPIILGLNFGWIIFAESVKNIKTLFLGVGPSNFITAFTLGKPVFFNNSPFWNIIFTSSSSFLFNIATEAGIVAGALFLAIFLKSFRLLVKSIHNLSSHQPIDNNQPVTYNLPARNATPARSDAASSGEHSVAGGQPATHNLLPYQISLVFVLILQIIFPSGMILFILTVVLLAFSSQNKHNLTIDLSTLHQAPYYLLVIPLLICTVVFYFGGRWYRGEMYYKQSLDAALNNQGDTAYNLELQAMNLSPRIDRYHVAFSRLNLALANALSAKENPTDEDKQNIPRLAQQAIDYGRNAVALNRTNISNWDNLAQTYGALINFASESGTWAITTYEQKMQLDPVNPQNHLNFGRLYQNLKKYPEAESEFRQAIALKPDLPASYYNLALLLQSQNRYQEAYQFLNTTKALVAPGSKDGEIVDNAIKELLKLDPNLATVSSQIAPPSNSNPQLNGSVTPAGNNPLTPKPTVSITPPPITP